MQMRSRFLVVPAALAAALALSQPGTAQVPSRDLPQPDAQALWDYLQGYQKDFRLFPGKDKLYKGSDPHGAWLTTYVNSTAYQALTSAGGGELPTGSILVKENYMPDKTLASVTVMYKAANFAPEQGNWFWLKRTADGKVEAAGKVAACASCHGTAARDYVLTPIKR